MLEGCDWFWLVELSIVPLVLVGLGQVCSAHFSRKGLLREVVHVVWGRAVQVHKLLAHVLVVVPVASLASDCWLNHLPLLLQLLLMDAPSWSCPNSRCRSLLGLVRGLQKYVFRLWLKIRFELFDRGRYVESGVSLCSSQSLSDRLLLFQLPCEALPPTSVPFQHIGSWKRLRQIFIYRTVTLFLKELISKIRVHHFSIIFGWFQTWFWIRPWPRAWRNALVFGLEPHLELLVDVVLVHEQSFPHSLRSNPFLGIQELILRLIIDYHWAILQHRVIVRGLVHLAHLTSLSFLEKHVRVDVGVHSLHIPEGLDGLLTFSEDLVLHFGKKDVVCSFLGF